MKLSAMLKKLMWQETRAGWGGWLLGPKGGLQLRAGKKTGLGHAATRTDFGHNPRELGSGSFPR